MNLEWGDGGLSGGIDVEEVKLIGGAADAVGEEEDVPLEP